MVDAWSALQGRKRSNPGAPLVTYLDSARGERVELSGASVENAGAKIANALREEWDCDPGYRVSIRLPLHWQRATWCAGIWTAGCLLVPGSDAQADLTVLDESSALHLVPATGTVVAVSLHPFGLPISSALPAGIDDATVPIRSQPDAYLFDPPLAEYSALTWEGVMRTQDEVWEHAAGLASAWGLGTGGRLLVTDDLDALDAWTAVLAVPLLTGGSVVLAVGEIDTETITAAERITAVASPTR
jgi:uncharacterized protein (TIGR03089 family)